MLAVWLIVGVILIIGWPNFGLAAALSSARRVVSSLSFSKRLCYVPRPERPPFVEEFRRRVPRYMLRHKVKAGMTGWAQINGWRGNTSIEKRIEYDLFYIERWTLGLDLKILILTVWLGFRNRNAY